MANKKKETKEVKENSDIALDYLINYYKELAKSKVHPFDMIYNGLTKIVNQIEDDKELVKVIRDIFKTEL